MRTMAVGPGDLGGLSFRRMVAGDYAATWLRLSRPAGSQGTTFQITLGGRYLDDIKRVYFSGSGVEARVLNKIEPMKSDEASALRKKLTELNETPERQAGREDPLGDRRAREKTRPLPGRDNAKAGPACHQRGRGAGSHDRGGRRAGPAGNESRSRRGDCRTRSGSAWAGCPSSASRSRGSSRKRRTSQARSASRPR